MLNISVLGSSIILAVSTASAQIPLPAAVEITTSMKIDVDGAPNAYGPPGKEALDFELNAHKSALNSGKIVGYITKKDGRTPVVQGKQDPFPGYYISTTGFFNRENTNLVDPARYLDAGRVNYVVLAKIAAKAGVALGDFVAVNSSKTHRSVYGVVGDSGNPSGAEGSLALLKSLGYPFTSGKSGEVPREITVRYFPKSNPERKFYRTQQEIDNRAKELGLNKDFSFTR